MAPEPTLVQFRALQTANEHRTAYGLRYNDYTRYRKHCANRTHRLRSTLKMTHGKGREFKKLPVLVSQTMKDNHLQLLLFEAERAWAYAQELYIASLQPNTSGNVRHGATGRFRRAVHWATELLSHCQAMYSTGRLSASNLIEATVYTLLLNGRFLRYRDEFEDALEQLCVARDMLDSLAGAAVTSKDQALATFFSDEISPEIRVCAHEIGRAKSYDVDAIVKEVAPQKRADLVDGYDQLFKKLKAERSTKAKNGTQQHLKPLQWDGKDVPVRNPELVDVLLSVQSAEAVLQAAQAAPEQGDGAQGKPRKGHKSRKGVAAFDGILLALSNAEDIAKKLVEAQQATGSSVASAPGTRDIQFLYSYIVYQLLSRRIQRDLSLVSVLVATQKNHPPQPKIQTQSSSSSPSPSPNNSNPPTPKTKMDPRIFPAIVKLLDTVLQSLSQMRTLDLVDETPDLANAIEARISFTKCRRCLYLARSYQAVRRYAEAVGLTQRCRLYHRESAALLDFGADAINANALAVAASSAESSSPAASSSSFYFVDESSLDTILAEVDSEETLLKREWFLYNGGTLSTEKDTSKKPLFFDIALNYVQLDMEGIYRAGGQAVPPAVSVSTVSTSAASMQIDEGKNKEKDSSKKGVSEASQVQKSESSGAGWNEGPKIPQARAKKEEEIERAATPTPQAAPRGGLSSLLGGWWGRS